MSETDEPQTVARIGVTTRSATGPAVQPNTKIVSVTRVTLPTFEVLYRDAEGAREDAVKIRSERAFELERAVEAQAGEEVVLELALQDFPFSISLLFRVVGRAGSRSLLEWWPRRQTDPKLLDLWIESLQTRSAPTPSTSSFPFASEVPDEAKHRLVELYRRTLSSNPFDVLGVHWTSGERIVREAAQHLRSELQQLAVLVAHDPQLSEYTGTAVARARQSADILGTVESRRDIRRQMVPDKELRNARAQADYLVQMARREGRPDAIANAERMLAELSV